MRGAKTVLWGLVAMAMATEAASTPATDDKVQPFKLNFEIHRGNDKRDMARDNQPRLKKRDDLLNMQVDNEKSFYLAKLKMGSNEDLVGVLVDTGSSDLWVMSHDLDCLEAPNQKREMVIKHHNANPDSKLKGHAKANEKEEKAEFTTFFITEGGGGGGGGGGFPGGGFPGGEPTATGGQQTNTCTKFGSFETAKSGTFNFNKSAPPFEIEYADGSGASGVWGFDDVMIGSTTVKSLSFAVANESSSNVGVLGIGLPGLEVTNVNAVGRPFQYQNLPLKLKADGVIKKNLFSLYLGQQSDNSGEILFGAVDHAKYSGQLQTVPMVNSYLPEFKDPIRVEVALSGIDVTSKSSNITVSKQTFAAVLDTGSTFSYLFEDTLDNLVKVLGGSFSDSAQAFVAPCTSDDSVKVVLNFSGARIEVPLTSLLVNTDQDGVCFLTVLPQQTSPGQPAYVLFGDNVLRNAYVVYDLDDFEVAFAQVNFTSDENVEIVSSSIPLAVKAPEFSSTSIASSAIDEEVTGLASFSASRTSGQKKKSSSSGLNIPIVMLFTIVGALVTLC